MAWTGFTVEVETQARRSFTRVTVCNKGRFDSAKEVTKVKFESDLVMAEAMLSFQQAKTLMLLGCAPW